MYKFLIIIIKGLNKRSRLPRRQTLAVGSFPLARDQLTLGTRGKIIIIINYLSIFVVTSYYTRHRFLNKPFAPVCSNITSSNVPEQILALERSLPN